MNSEFILLLTTAASIAFIHTVLGPDHYLPFIVMSKSRKWSLPKTIWITIACGLGHVGSSIVIGCVGIALGIGIGKIEGVESFRGSIAGWAFFVFGLAYMVWGIHQAIRNKPHTHLHVHDNGQIHSHTHLHEAEHTHVHDEEGTHTHAGDPNTTSPNLTPWVLFIIFVLGPCEPLIPILMYPAAEMSLVHVAAVAALFSIVTIITMLGVVLLGYWGIDFLPVHRLERYAHAIAGAIIFLSGFAMIFLGL